MSWKRNRYAIIASERTRKRIIKLRTEQGLSMPIIAWLCSVSKQYVQQTLKAGLTAEEYEESNAYAREENKKIHEELYPPNGYIPRKIVHGVQRRKETPEERYEKTVKATKRWIEKTGDHKRQTEKNTAKKNTVRALRETLLDED